MSLPKVEIYTKFACPYCVRAKALLSAKGVEVEEFDITMGGPKARGNACSGHPMLAPFRRFSSAISMSVAPTICAALDRQGKLDALLGL